MNRPLLSVLITTFNRAPLLRLALEGLAHQWAAPSFEVIVIDDGSTDDTHDVVNSFSDRINIRYAYQSNSGIASARNHALFQASAPIVLMQDDDDIPDHYLISEHFKAHARHSENHSAVLGRTRLSDDIAQDPLMHHVTSVGHQLFSYTFMTDDQALDYRCFWGGRASCKREFLLSHGVFNPLFRFGCEDIELAFRLARHGFNVFYAEKALTTMVRGVSLDQFLQRLRKQAASGMNFYRLHPCPEVANYVGLQNAMSWEQKDHGLCDQAVSRAQTLDAIARDMNGSGLDMDGQDRELLALAYNEAFSAVYETTLYQQIPH